LIGLVLPAAGSGSRIGSEIPKQFIEFQGKRLYRHALDAFLPFVSEVVVVVPEAWVQTIREETSEAGKSLPLYVTAGGRQRQDSVRCGLMALSSAVEIVLIHDAARPYVSSSLIGRVIEGARRSKACIPVVSVSETVKEVNGEQVVGTLDRERLRLVQTPQGFEARLLREAFDRAASEAFYGTDESMLVERMGWPVTVVAGDQGNIKVTWKEDFLQIGGRL
jgi:2-C-methyl-D-erythritol 4-phosphate cytidylyltransferase